MLKKLLSLTMLFCLLSTQNVFADSSENYDYYYQEFLVSAYYSPLPNQARYIRGSLESDIRLNGRGTNGADGTEVFMGMLAAPKGYSFGTKIDLPGLGVGSVHDRGGAIVKKATYHRIDVWMGHGDVGLSRALNWGMRKMTGKVYFSKDRQVSLDYTTIPANSPVVAAKKQVKKAVSVLSKNLSFGTIDPQVVKLKQTLKSLGYFAFETNNNYFGVNLKNAVLRFQKEQGVIKSDSDQGAGYVGLQTRAALDLAVNKKPADSVAEKREENKVAIYGSIGKNSSNQDIENLQTVLKAMGYYRGELNGKYSNTVIEAVFAFQKDQGIVKNKLEAGAGNFGPKTLAAYRKILDNREKKLKKYPLSKENIIEGDSPKKNQIATIIKTNSVSFPSQKFDLLSSKLKIGDENAEVKELQNFLADKGYLARKHTTGYFGPITANAVEMAKNKSMSKSKILTKNI